VSTVSLPAWLSVSAIVVVLDRVTKLAVVSRLELGEEVPVLPVFSWVRLHNEGAAFSLLQNAGGWQRWFFVVLAVAFSIYLVYELRRLPASERLQAFGFSLILGGALGNMIDRATVGYVVDFALAHWRHTYFFPAFNVADSAITVGAIAWIWTMLREMWQRRGSGAGAGNSS